MNKNKRYSIVTLTVVSLCLLCTAILTIYVDPYFHYHAPVEYLSYTFSDQRYINDGISRNFSYDAIITGTSMTENFKTSEFDRLFNVKSIKVPFSGGSYKEINQNLKRAISENKNLKYVLRGIDYSFFFTDKNILKENFDYPIYMTNDIIWDDIYYIFNKSIFFNKVVATLMTYNKQGGKLTSFDKYSNWYIPSDFGKNNVLKSYKRAEKKLIVCHKNDKEIAAFQENIDENIISCIKENPNIEFYYFFTPYSILYWDDLIQKNILDNHILAEKMIIESLLQYKNVHIFSFSDEFNLTTNLDNYKDIAHYSENINSYILDQISNKKKELKMDNYLDYLHRIRIFYSHYNYELLFKKTS